MPSNYEHRPKKIDTLLPKHVQRNMIAATFHRHVLSRKMAPIVPRRIGYSACYLLKPSQLGELDTPSLRLLTLSSSQRVQATAARSEFTRLNRRLKRLNLKLRERGFEIVLRSFEVGELPSPRLIRLQPETPNKGGKAK